MKRTYLLIFLLVTLFSVQAQELAMLDNSTQNYSYLDVDDDDNKLGIFAISFEPLGFVQFGPIVHAEIALPINLVFNTHYRAASRGLLSKVIRAGDEDQFSGYAIGGGLRYFFTKGKNKPFIGTLFEREKTEATYDEGYSYEEIEEVTTSVFMLNGGMRFRFNGGFFMNVGVYFGAARYESYDYEPNSEYGLDPNWNDGVKPFGMLEFGLGFEI